MSVAPASLTFAGAAREERLFAKLRSLLQRVARSDESILTLASSAPPQESFLASLFSSARRCVLVLTNHRLLCVATTTGFVPLESVSEVAWGDVVKMRVSWFRKRFRLHYRSGRVESFPLLRRADAKRIRSLLSGLSGTPTDDLERRYLCPDCGHRVPVGAQRCGHCGLAFRHVRYAVRFALWWPGGGYFYLGRPSAGVLAVFVEALLLTAAWFTSQLADLGRVSSPGRIYLALIAGWILWKTATAFHVAAASREPIADRRAAERDKQMPPALARQAWEGTEATAKAAVEAAEWALDAGSEKVQYLRAAASELVKSETAQQEFERARAAWEGIEATAERALEAGTEKVQSLRDAASELVKAETSAHDFLRVERKSAAVAPAVELWEGVPFGWGMLRSHIPLAEQAGFAQEQRKLLSNVRPALLPLLESGEHVLYVTPGATPFSVIDYFGPILLLYFIRRCVFVFSDRRLFMIRIGLDDKPLPSISVIRYEDLHGYRFAGGYGLTINFKLGAVYTNGRKETFNRIPFEHFIRLQTLLPRFLSRRRPESKLRPIAVRQRVHVCIFCGSMLRPGIYQCSQCGAAYRRKSIATWCAALLPGGGFFYTGKTKLGVVDAVIEVFLFANLIGILIAMLAGEWRLFTQAALLYVLFIAVEKFVSIHHARELAAEYIPAGRPPAREPVLDLHRDDSGWILTTVVLAFGFLLIVMGISVRLPLYPKQWELSKSLAELSRRQDAFTRLENRVVVETRELERLSKELEAFNRYRSWKSHSVTEYEDFPFPILEFTDDRDLDRNYQNVLREFRVHYDEYERVRPEYEKLAAEYNAISERAEALDAEIGNAWFSASVKEVLQDLAARAFTSVTPESVP